MFYDMIMLPHKIQYSYMHRSGIFVFWQKCGLLYSHFCVNSDEFCVVANRSSHFSVCVTSVTHTFYFMEDKKMEENQITQSTTQQPQINKKMTSCRTCGASMARTAKKCPSCGAKNTKRKLIKLLVFVVIICSLFGISFISKQPKKAEIGEIYTSKNGIEFSVDAVSFYRGEKTGISEIDNSPCISIEGTFENKSKNTKNIYGHNFKVDFDDGYKYSSDYMYLKSSSYTDISGEEHKEFKLYEPGVKLEPLESGIQEFIILIPVSDAVFNGGDKELSITAFNHKYKFDSVSEIPNSKEDTIDRLTAALG